MRNSDGTFGPGNNFGTGRNGPNKVTSDRKAKLLQVCQAIEKNHLDGDLKALEPADRVRIWIQINEFLLPKLQRIQAEIEIPETIEQLLTMPAEERRQRIIQLRELIQQQNDRQN